MLSRDYANLRRSPAAVSPSTQFKVTLRSLTCVWSLRVVSRLCAKQKIHPEFQGKFQGNSLRPSIGYVTISPMMNSFRFAAFFLGLFLLSGCAWLGLSRNVVGDKNIPGETSVADSFVKTGKVIDVERLKKGGKVLVVPFSAGVNVTADERSDKIALMIVKGIADELKEGRFQILSDENAQEADLIITGHVTGAARPSKWSWWFFKRSQNTVSVEGRMADAASGAAVLVFTHSARASAREKDHAQLGYDIGKDIGRFIGSAAD